VPEEEEVVAAGAVVVVAADEEAVLSVPLFDEDEAEAGMLEDFFLAFEFSPALLDEVEALAAGGSVEELAGAAAWA